MKWAVNKEIKTLDEYMEMPAQVIYVYDLKHCGPRLINEGIKKDWHIMGAKGTPSTKKPTLRHQTHSDGKNSKSPCLQWIELPNYVKLIDYSAFDSTVDPTEDEMKTVAQEIENYVTDDVPIEKITTAAKIIEIELSKKKKTKMFVQRKANDDLIEDYAFVKEARKGGATAIMPQYLNKEIERETHIDYHQIYAYAMTHTTFPLGTHHLVEGPYESELSIYELGGQARAKVKEDGFPILPTGNGTAGANGEWFDLQKTLPYLCDSDFQLLKENYILDGTLYITRTMYWDLSFSGERMFSDMINHFYKKRQEAKKKGLKNVESFYKKINEVLPGYFQKSMYAGGFWHDMEKPKGIRKGVTYYDPSIGVFLTAKARRMLSDLLYKFPHDQVIGFDTDCAFIAAKSSKAFSYCKDIEGPNMGQVHEDVRLANAIHTAPKQYDGWDILNNVEYHKHSGMSSDGYINRWNLTIREYEKIKQEVKRVEKPR